MHEYIHYQQASCNDDFIERFGWGWKEGAPSGAVAYMNINNCSSPQKVNESEPIIFNVVFSLVYITLAARFVLEGFYPLIQYYRVDFRRFLVEKF